MSSAKDPSLYQFYVASIKKPYAPSREGWEWYSESTHDWWHDYELMRKEADEGNERAQRFLAAFIAERMKG